MPYAFVNAEGAILSQVTKPNPRTRLKAGERIVRYDPPEVDSSLYTVTAVVPVIGKQVEFTVQEHPEFASLQTERLLKEIDADVDKLYTEVIGNREPEYRQAELDAIAFKASGYSAKIPESLQGYIAASGYSAKEAADRTIQAAQDWRSAIDRTRAARLLAKAEVRSGNRDLSAWKTFLTTLRGTL